MTSFEEENDMNVSDRLKKESVIRDVLKMGYTRKIGSLWYKRCEKDYREFSNIYTNDEIRKAHEMGFRAKSIDRYNLLEKDWVPYLSDLKYMFLSPMNSSFSKWIAGILLTRRILGPDAKHLHKIYYSVFRRDKKLMFINREDEPKSATIEDVENLLREKKSFLITPGFWNSVYRDYEVYLEDDDLLTINGHEADWEELRELIYALPISHLITEIRFPLVDETKIKMRYKLYFSHDLEGNATILEAIAQKGEVYSQIISDPVDIMAERLEESKDNVKRSALAEENLLKRARYMNINKYRYKAAVIDRETGVYELNNEEYTVDKWDEVKEICTHIAKKFSVLTFFSMTATVTDGEIKIINFNASPVLPETEYGQDLINYLNKRYDLKKQNFVFDSKKKAKTYKKFMFDKYVRKFCRPGIRPYMQDLWYEAVKDDYKNTKGYSLAQKRWAWKRGYLSFRIHQYGLTNNNYKNFLSDYNYMWLNRINNDYQVWINDKMTFRYAMENFKENVAEYYYLFRLANGEMEVTTLMDCPEGYKGSMEEILRLLREKKILACKPSAGLHGDGFYRLEWEDGQYMVNEQPIEEQDLMDLLCSFTSYYLVTEYFFMSEELRVIYPKSVNTIRMMMINNTDNAPQVMQAYMRIGSSKSGFTDNVAFGGIIANIDVDTGFYSGAEKLIDHYYESCPIHPDTGVLIEGTISNWEEIKDLVKRICRTMPELEYLGFDVVASSDGIKILEINIHQDLHKVGEYTDEINAFFKKKLALKAERFGLKEEDLY